MSQMRTLLFQTVRTIASCVLIALMSINLFPLPALAQELIPHPDQSFTGRIGLTYKDSEPTKSKLKLPSTYGIENAPNILLVLIDDMGYGQTSTFGSPIPTPTLDRLAKNGLRYTQFHTTALCSPTRAALLTGRNHHSAATGIITEAGTGFPGYTGEIPKSAGTFAQILRDYGYATAWLGLAIGHLLGIGYEPDIQSGIAVSTIARNAGLAIFIAALNEQPKVVPVIIGVLVVGIVAGLPYSVWMKRKMTQSQTEPLSDASAVLP